MGQPGLVEPLKQMTMVATRQRRFDEAEAYARRAYAITVPGAATPDRATAAAALGAVSPNLEDRLDEAGALYREAWSVRTAVLGPTTPKRSSHSTTWRCWSTRATTMRRPCRSLSRCSRPAAGRSARPRTPAALLVQPGGRRAAARQARSKPKRTSAKRCRSAGRSMERPTGRWSRPPGSWRRCCTSAASWQRRGCCCHGLSPRPVRCRRRTREPCPRCSPPTPSCC